MPLLTPDVVAAGTFVARHSQQSRLARAPSSAVGSRDAQAVFEAFADPEIRRWHVRTATCRDEVESWIESWGADWCGGAQLIGPLQTPLPMTCWAGSR